MRRTRSERSPRHDRLAPRPGLLALAAAVAAPFAVSAVRLVATVGRGWYPSSDYSLIEMQTRAVGVHAVLLGPYSRTGFHFPGPALFYTLALPYRLVGSRPIGLLLGALAINAVAIVGTVWVSWRRGGFPLTAIVVIATLLLIRSFGAGFLTDPWNPYVTLLPFSFLVLLAWSIGVGDIWMLPVATVVASFVVQSHLEYAGVSAVMLAWAVGVRAYSVGRDRAGRAGRVRRAARPVAVSFGIAALLWLPPLIDQVNGDGNLGKTVRYFTTHSGSASWADAFRSVALQWSWRPEWLFGTLRPDIGVVPFRTLEFPLLAVLAIGCVAFAARHRDLEKLVLAGTVGCACVAAVYSMHSVVGPLYPYLTRWTWVLGMWLGILCAWTAVDAALSWRPLTGSRALRPLVVAGLGVATATCIVAATRLEPPREAQSPLVRALSSQLASRGGGRTQPMLVDGRVLSGFSWEVTGELQRHAIPIVTTPQGAFFYGRWLEAPKGRTYPRMTVFMGTEAARAAAAPPPGTTVIAHARIPPDPRAARATLELGVATARYEAGRDSAEVRRVRQLLEELSAAPNEVTVVVTTA